MYFFHKNLKKAAALGSLGIAGVIIWYVAPFSSVLNLKDGISLFDFDFFSFPEYWAKDVCMVRINQKIKVLHFIL